MTRRISITFSNETGGSRTLSWQLQDDETFSFDIEPGPSDPGLALHDWGYAPEDSELYQMTRQNANPLDRIIPDYALSLPGNDSLLAEVAVNDGGVSVHVRSER